MCPARREKERGKELAVSEKFTILEKFRELFSLFFFFHIYAGQVYVRYAVQNNPPRYFFTLLKHSLLCYRAQTSRHFTRHRVHHKLARNFIRGKRTPANLAYQSRYESCFEQFLVSRKNRSQ